MRVKKATLKRKGRKKITIHLDGEPMTLSGKLKIKVIEHALQVIVPVTKKSWRKLLG
jgi:diacylglycerol kinase family enzyme